MDMMAKSRGEGLLANMPDEEPLFNF